jgi:hypothetical protein
MPATASSDDAVVAMIRVREASAGEAAARGRMGYDISADRLLLHRIQTEEAFDALLSSGVLMPDKAFAEPSFAEAYDWMLRQMAARLPTAGNGAVWFWARTTRRDLMDSCRQSSGSVLLTCRVPRELVLFSHFFDWHNVLNRQLQLPALRGESDDAYCSRMDRVLDDFKARLQTGGAGDSGIEHWPEDLRNEIEKSWEHILEPGNYGHFECWQGTAHVLAADNVVEAVRLHK